GFLTEDWEAITALEAAGAIAAPRLRTGLLMLDMLLASNEPPNDEWHPVIGPLIDPSLTTEFQVLLTGIGGDQLSSAGERGAIADRVGALRPVRAWRDAGALARAYGGPGHRARIDVLWSSLSPRVRHATRRLAGRDA